MALKVNPVLSAIIFMATWKTRANVFRKLPDGSVCWILLGGSVGNSYRIGSFPWQRPYLRQRICIVYEDGAVIVGTVGENFFVEMEPGMY